jgi:abhydrolase domain-containing protein 17
VRSLHFFFRPHPHIADRSGLIKTTPALAKILPMIRGTIESIAFMPPRPCTSLPTLPHDAIFRWVAAEKKKKTSSFSSFSSSAADDEEAAPDPENVRAVPTVYLPPPPQAAARSPRGRAITLLFSHGNAEDLGSLVHRFDDWRHALGAGILLYDYPGYSYELRAPAGTGVPPELAGIVPEWATADGDGQPDYGAYEAPSEAWAFRAANAVCDYALGELGISEHDLVLCGHSLGSGPTTELASTRPSAGVVLMSPLRSAMRMVAPSIPGVGDIMKNQDKIHKISAEVDVFVIHGTDDSVIPVEHGQYLNGRLSHGNSFGGGWFVEGHDHNDLEEHAEFFDRLNGYLDHVAALDRPAEHLQPGHKERVRPEHDSDSDAAAASPFSSSGRSGGIFAASFAASKGAVASSRRASAAVSNKLSGGGGGGQESEATSSDDDVDG